MSQQGPCNWRADADPAFVGAGLVSPYYAIAVRFIILVEQVDPGTKKNPGRIIWPLCNDCELIHAPGQVAHPPVYFPQFLFTINVFGVFRAITLSRRIRQGAGYGRTAYSPEMFQFIAQALPARARNVVAFHQA